MTAGGDSGGALTPSSSSAPLRKPVPPVYADVETAPGAAGKTIRLVGAVTTSKRPQLRPRSDVVVVATAAVGLDFLLREGEGQEAQDQDHGYPHVTICYND